MVKNDLFLSVIVPSYNETKELKERSLEEIDKFLQDQPYSYEVLVVDDMSSNGTLEFVKDWVKAKRHFRVIENSHGGKAITVMTGMLESRGQIALFTDMDQATPIDQVEALLLKFTDGVDVVIGSRNERKGAPIERKIMSWGFSTLRNLILGLPFRDTQCGFKAFNRKAIETIFPDMLKYWVKMKARGAAVNAGFDVELLFLAKKRELVVVEAPVVWRHVENVRQVQVVSDSIEAVKDLVRIRLNDIRRKYS